LGDFFGDIRYNMFILFYPIGAICDTMATYHSAQPIRELGLYTMSE